MEGGADVFYSSTTAHELQGYLAHKNSPPPQGLTVALRLGTYGDPREVGVSYERGTPVGQT